MRFNVRHTLYASYCGYFTQAIINNLPALLFVTFQKTFDLSLEKIGLLISVNFIIQILVDSLAARYIDRIGYRIGIVGAHALAAAGLVLMGTLPYLLSDPFAGLLTAVCINAVGGGLIEVLVSPIVDALPSDKKSASMSLLHSFYCWGQVAVVLLSTAFFVAFDTTHWYILVFLWAFIPFCNMLFFSRVPLPSIEDEVRVPFRKLVRKKLFWLLLILMLCSGATEIALAQWTSLFAESGLGVSKTTGDLLGLCMFAILMGVSRVFYGFCGGKINLRLVLTVCSAGCVGSYLLTVFARNPILSLAGCALCGLFVGLMWPGVISLSSKYFSGGTAMFAVLALAGDFGCSFGPGLVGVVSNAVEQGKLVVPVGLFSSSGLIESGLKSGILAAAVFPTVLFLGLLLLNVTRKLGKRKLT